MFVTDDAANAGSGELPERWSAKSKLGVVLRLCRGENLGAVSGDARMGPRVVDGWRRAFLEGGLAGLKSRGGDPLEVEPQRARAKPGETLMKLELGELLVEKGWRESGMHFLMHFLS